MLLRVLDLLGVAVFAVSGALAGIGAQLDLLGILVLASVTAVGGGTIRDLLLNRYPIFWIEDPWPVFSIFAATTLTLIWVHSIAVPTNALLIADAFGLSLFAMSGARIAESRGCRAPVIVLMGTLTGAGGGVVRDLLSAKVPLILRQDIYASAAIAGIGVYLLMRAARVPTGFALAAGFVSVLGVRLTAIAFNLRLPAFALPQ
ncbi:trimeric intracellular cation channel family protein [Aquincola sp. MAHUQ-54]|uniref:Trimeric intracellular cation channel family protein n=1 Tax=Aquincola agrisoli TaxID=3119538 RepID=A0AAW9QPP7_9BURK